jgi:hypothetical protein
MTQEVFARVRPYFWCAVYRGVNVAVLLQHGVWTPHINLTLYAGQEFKSGEEASLWVMNHVDQELATERGQRLQIALLHSPQRGSARGRSGRRTG